MSQQQNRTHDDVLRLIMEKLDAHIAETKESRIAVAKSINCLRDSMYEFKDKYSATLDQAIDSKIFWNELRDNIIKNGILAALSIVALGVLAGPWVWIKTQLGLPSK